MKTCIKIPAQLYLRFICTWHTFQILPSTPGLMSRIHVYLVLLCECVCVNKTNENGLVNPPTVS